MGKRGKQFTLEQKLGGKKSKFNPKNKIFCFGELILLNKRQLYFEEKIHCISVKMKFGSRWAEFGFVSCLCSWTCLSIKFGLAFGNDKKHQPIHTSLHCAFLVLPSFPVTLISWICFSNQTLSSIVNNQFVLNEAGFLLV